MTFAPVTLAQAAQAGLFVLDFTFRNDCLFRYSVDDGQREPDRFFQKGEQFSIDTAKKQVTIWMSNAGAARMRVQGKDFELGGLGRGRHAQGRLAQGCERGRQCPRDHPALLAPSGGAGRTFHLESLGCAKNQVDAELMIAALERAGWARAQGPEDAEVLIVNTCGFISAAKKESIETSLELKARYPGKRLVMVGCLSERYAGELRDELPEIDGFLGDRRPVRHRHPPGRAGRAARGPAAALRADRTSSPSRAART